MQIFRDKNGKDWTIEITVGSVKAIKDALGVDLIEAISDKENNLIGRIYQDPAMLVNSLYVLCLDQANDAGISDTDFGHLFSGDSIESATEAFITELIAFFPKSRRELIRKIWLKVRAVDMAGLERIDKEMDQIDPVALVNHEIDRRLSGKPFTAPLQS